MKTAKLFQNGRSQAVRLPQDFRMPGSYVFIKKIDNVTVLIPVENAWEPFFNSLKKFTDDFMKDRAQPKEQKRDFFQ